MRYDRFGVWRVGRTSTGTAAFTKVAAEADGGSDTVVLTGDLRWVVTAEKMTYHPIEEKS